MMTRGRFALVGLLALGGCFGGGKSNDKDVHGDKVPSKSAEPSFAAALKGLKIAPIAARDEADGLVFGVGKLEATLPRGWGKLTIAGQTKFISPSGAESLQVFAYNSDETIDDKRMNEIAAALSEMGGTGEHLIGRFAKVDLSTPTNGRTAWGVDSRFSAIGPLNRMAFHYATVGPHEALLIQLDGNNQENTAAHAVALIRSIRYVGKEPPAAPTAKDAPKLE